MNARPTILTLLVALITPGQRAFVPALGVSFVVEHPGGFLSVRGEPWRLSNVLLV